MTLLPRAGLALALLLSFFNPENLPGGLSLSEVNQSIARRDGTFFDKNTGALSTYAKGVLIANAAWAGWRTLVLLLSRCVALSLFLVIEHILNSIIYLGSVSGYSANMAVWGSVGPDRDGRRKSDVQLRSEAKSRNLAWPRLWVPAASINFPGAGKSVLSYAFVRRTSFASRFAHHAVRSRPSVLPKVDSRASRMSLLLWVSAVVRNRRQPAGACSRRTSLRARMPPSRAGVVRQLDRKAYPHRRMPLFTRSRW